MYLKPCLVISTCLGYGTESLQQEKWLLDEKLRVTRESISMLDSQVEYQVASLPSKINQAMDDIISDIEMTNIRYAGIVAAIATGRLLRIYGAFIDDTNITPGDILSTVVGGPLLSASFAASRLARVKQKPLFELNEFLIFVSDHESKC